jgi:putative FmdB family regulatory protein
MPVYDYKCRDHGLFFELSTMAEAHLPKPCPECQQMAGRVICIAPELLAMPADRKHAFETNEKAQNEPVFSTPERREQDHQHSKGCGCTAKKRGSKMLYTAAGEKIFPSMRPWMISH